MLLTLFWPLTEVSHMKLKLPYELPGVQILHRCNHFNHSYSMRLYIQYVVASNDWSKALLMLVHTFSLG